MIVMLGYPELDTEVSDTGMETTESNDCRGVSKKDGDANGVLAAGVQLVVFYTTIEAQIVFETLLVLVTGQLAIAGQLGREVHLRSIGLLLGSGKQR